MTQQDNCTIQYQISIIYLLLHNQTIINIIRCTCTRYTLPHITHVKSVTANNNMFNTRLARASRS